MTEQNLPAGWAIGEALERGRIYHLNIAYVKAAPRNYSLTIELARMIEKHEKPPVDPDVLAVREIFPARVGRRRRMNCHLTTRETEVMRLVTEGYSSEQVAAELGISRKTVDIHRRNANVKLGAKTACHAAALFVRNGIQ